MPGDSATDLPALRPHKGIVSEPDFSNRCVALRLPAEDERGSIDGAWEREPSANSSVVEPRPVRCSPTFFKAGHASNPYIRQLRGSAGDSGQRRLHLTNLRSMENRCAAARF